MQSSLQFTVAAQFNNDNLVDAQAHEIEGLVRLFFLVHGALDVEYLWLLLLPQY